MSLSSSTRRTRPLANGNLPGRDRQTHRERSAQSRCALDRDVATACLHDLPDDPQPQTEAAEFASGRGAREAIEDGLLFIELDTDAVVGHTENGAGRVEGEIDLDWL